ncbi:hypothetical protein Bca4012_007135 [Brassica carinata]
MFSSNRSSLFYLSSRSKNNNSLLIRVRIITLSLAPKSISKHSVYSTTIAGSRYEWSNQMEVGLDSFQRQVAERFIDLNSGEG